MVIGLIYLILLISQLGKHFWPGWSFVEGIKVDYLSPTLYLTDVVWIILVLNHKIQIPRTKQITRSKFQFTKIIFLLILINIVLAERWQVAVYGWFRLWQVWWWVNYFSKNKKEVIKFLGWIIPWWIGLETFLALGQVVGGGSLGGIFYWLGERKFDYLSLGIARISWFGDQYVRAYGTFSHPNSLAGFLLVGMVMWNEIMTNNEDKNRRSFATLPPSLKLRRTSRMTLTGKVKRWLVIWFEVLGIILTGSRLVWGVGILMLIFNFQFLIFNFFKKITNKRRHSNAFRTKIGLIFIGLGVFIMGGSILMSNFEIVGGWSVNSLDLRWKLLKSGWNMWRQNWLFGVGLNNFLINLPDFMKGYWWLQPVHNIFVLWLVETGLIGLIGIGVFLVKRIDFKKYALVWMIIVLTGMFDHYWLTLPQNMGLLGLVLGLSKKPLPNPPLDKGGENN